MALIVVTRAARVTSEIIITVGKENPRQRLKDFDLKDKFFINIVFYIRLYLLSYKRHDAYATLIYWGPI